MEEKSIDKSRAVVDSEIDQETPTVFVLPEKAPEKSEQRTDNIFALLIKRTVTFFLDFLETIVVALSIFVVVYLFLFQPHEVKGSSMEPSFSNNEYILTDKISYRFSGPKRGDVVIFKSPKNPDVDYIKRIIGLPSERIKIERGNVFVNGEILNETYINPPTNLFPGSILSEGKEIVIPEGKYFVLGDNRLHSSDSREFGPIGEDLIIGKAFMRYWPISAFGPLKEVNYSLTN